jgi:hypothetical protein
VLDEQHRDFPAAKRSHYHVHDIELLLDAGRFIKSPQSQEN